MLLQLEIYNIALIEHVCIDFENGLNVLSGETGAGKSIIIDSINAVLGGRLARDLIRTGCESASVTAVYNFSSHELDNILESQGIPIEEDGTVIISREFSLQGRNICRINSRVVPLSALKQVGALLIDLHGQHDNQSLLNISKHIELLDAFGGNRLTLLKEEYSDKLNEYKKLVLELNKFTRNIKERESRLDLLGHQIKEIKQAKLRNGEEEELISRKNILASAEKIKLNLSSSYIKLYEGFENNSDSSGYVFKNSTHLADCAFQNGSSAYDLMNQAEQELAVLGKIDERYRMLSEKLTGVNCELFDIIEEIRNEKEKIEFEPGEMEEIEDRISLIKELKRKYGKNISDILEYLANAEEENNKLINSDENTKKLEIKIAGYKKELGNITSEITSLRKKAASVLESGIIKHFEDLEMKNAGFKVSFTETEDFLADGADIIEFLVSPNLGEPLKALAKIASGGEMSRIMLAIKAMLAATDNIPTLIFDEIDTGISGAAAARVGEKMAVLSKHHQILCVTHIARIAACANNNILIEKHAADNKTRTYVRKLRGEELVQEISRLLDGDSYSEATRQHAVEMITNSKKIIE